MYSGPGCQDHASIILSMCRDLKFPFNKLTYVFSGFQSRLLANEWAYSLQAIPCGDPEPGSQKHVWTQLLSQTQAPLIKLHAEIKCAERKIKSHSCRGTLMETKHWNTRGAALAVTSAAEILEQGHDTWRRCPTGSRQVTLEGVGFSPPCPEMLAPGAAFPCWQNRPRGRLR